MYVRIPIRMSLVGSYHQINRFFRNIGELKRIVTISDLHLSSSEGQAAAGGASARSLKAEFVAQTFQFQDKPAAPPPGAPAGGE
jgi:type IV pilus assembly protein PilO